VAGCVLHIAVLLVIIILCRIVVSTLRRHVHVADMENGEVGDMQQLGVTESYRVKQQVLISGAEAAEMILRVDNILKSAPRQRHPDYRPC